MLIVNKKRLLSVDDWAEIIDDLGLADDLTAAHTVAVKPNFAAGTYVEPDGHVVSDLSLVASFVRYVLSLRGDSTVLLAEADSTGYGFAYLKFEHLGLPGSLGLSEAELARVELLDMSRDRLVRAEDPRFLRYMDVDHQLWVSERFARADFRVDFSNLKTHSVTGYTGACKNLFGCLPETEKWVNHPYIHKTVHDLTLALSPRLSVVDAFYGMERNGPVQGRPVDSGFRVFSDSPVEADVYGAHCAGFDPGSVKYLRYLLRDLPIDECEFPPLECAPYERPQAFLRVMNTVGLAVQRAGAGVERFGHKVHTAYSPLVLGVMLLRPLLLRLFDLDTLKAMKRRVMGGR